ncbi:aLK and LTK ligand 2a [Salarias fasciatus]|uniref:ALK and LTK ligand 2-like n=1 Tax=Salarias fasciatus TaxID=181472 RepID=A0A672HQF1_SALFA|nr:ALK and LTK ligand 2-like [Salarias fasciatus]
MSGLRKRVIMGLVLLLCALTDHCGESAPSAAPSPADAGAGAQQDFRRLVEIVKHVEDSRGHHGARMDSPLTPLARSAEQEQRDAHSLRAERGTQAAAVFPRDLRKKEKFLKHLTGPLYFSPKCRKNVYRVYHHTRDCTIPAYFKRCARLLTRLAGSPQCTEG